MIRASPDGSRVYVGGDFTTVDGAARNHIAAFNTATGALDDDVPPVGELARCRARGAPRPSTSAAASSPPAAVGAHASRRVRQQPTGRFCRWAPTADDNKVTRHGDDRLTAPGSSSAAASPRSTAQAASGMGALDATHRRNRSVGRSTRSSPTAAPSAASRTSSVDNNQVYGGRATRSGAATSRAPSRRTATPAPSVWVNDCHGDTYDTYPVGQVLYSVSHAHDCSFIGDFPNTNPLVDEHAPRARVHDLPDRHQRRPRRLRLELQRRARLDAAAVVPRSSPSAATPVRPRRRGR